MKKSLGIQEISEQSFGQHAHRELELRTPQCQLLHQLWGKFLRPATFSSFEFRATIWDISDKKMTRKPDESETDSSTLPPGQHRFLQSSHRSYYPNSLEGPGPKKTGDRTTRPRVTFHSFQRLMFFMILCHFATLCHISHALSKALEPRSWPNRSQWNVSKSCQFCATKVVRISFDLWWLCFTSRYV